MATSKVTSSSNEVASEQFHILKLNKIHDSYFNRVVSELALYHGLLGRSTVSISSSNCMYITRSNATSKQLVTVNNPELKLGI